MKGPYSTPVAVTGLGAVTPAGIGVSAFWQRLCDGTPTAARDPQLAGMPVDFSCRVPDFDPGALLGRKLSWRIDRFIQMALVAAREAVTDARLQPAAWDSNRVGVVIGAGTSGPDRWPAEYAHLNAGNAHAISPMAVPRSNLNMVAGEIACDLQALGPCLVTATACASGSTAIGVARDLLRSGSCDIVITGGSESQCMPMGSATFDRMGALSRRREDPRAASRPFDVDRDGFVLGEGAAIMILERTDHAYARGVPARAFLAGYGASADGHHYAAPDPTGAGVQRAISTAIADAAIADHDIGFVNTHGTGTRLNDLAEATALRKHFTNPPPATANKSIMGHAIGGAGAMEAVATVLSLQHQLIPPTANLDCIDPDIGIDIVAGRSRLCRLDAAISNSFGFGGQNAVLVFTRDAAR